MRDHLSHTTRPRDCAGEQQSTESALCEGSPALRSSAANAPTTAGQYEFANTFAQGATIAPGDVYVVCHPSANPTSITAECDETTWQYLSNGDDGWCLLKGDATTYTFIDCVGDFEGDPGNGWDVCGVSEATKDMTLVRKAGADTVAPTQAAVGAAKPSEAIWEYTSVTECQWDLYPQDTHNYVGSHSVTTVAGTAAWCGVRLGWFSQCYECAMVEPAFKRSLV